MDMLILGRVYFWILDDVSYLQRSTVVAIEISTRDMSLAFMGQNPAGAISQKGERIPGAIGPSISSDFHVISHQVAYHVTSGRMSVHIMFIYIISCDPSRWLVCEQSNLFKRQTNADC